MSDIVFLEVDKQDEPLIREHFPQALISSSIQNENEILEICKNAEIISCFIHSRFTNKVLHQLPKLKLLCTRSVGYDHIDVEACREKKITVCNVPDYGSHVIAEHVFALLLATLRHIREGEERMESGTFDYHGLRGIALKGKTIGILGTGKIGSKVAKIAHGFEMHIIAYDQCRTTELEKELSVTYVPLETLFQESDILTLHIPGTKETEHLINATAFSQMKKGVVLVNTARGSLIDSTELLQALNNGKVSHALLDVLEHEQNFQENKELVQHPNVVTTPHIAFYADDSMHNMFTDCFSSMKQWRELGSSEHEIKPLNIVCEIPAKRN